MSKSIFFLLLQICLMSQVWGCGCGCGCGVGPGVKLCDDDPCNGPLEIQKPLCPPPPSICKELGIPPHPYYYSNPNPNPWNCGCGQQPRPRCLLKPKPCCPFCISKSNLQHRLALAKHRVFQGGCGGAPPPPPPYNGGCFNKPSCGCSQY